MTLSTAPAKAARSTRSAAVKPAPARRARGTGTLTVSRPAPASRSAPRTPPTSPYSPADAAVAWLVAEPGVAAASAVSGVPAHDMVVHGVSADVFATVRQSFKWISQKDLLNAVGISDRTAQRLGADPAKRLDPSASDRVLQLIKVRHLASDVLGSQAAAEQWMAAPALGLAQRRPIDLMRSTEGIHLVSDLLHRMQHGVYA